MKIEELEKLAKMIVLNRPQHYKYMRDDDISILAQSWLLSLGKFDYETALICFNEWLKYSRTEPFSVGLMADTLESLGEVILIIEGDSYGGGRHRKLKIKPTKQELLDFYKREMLGYKRPDPHAEKNNFEIVLDSDAESEICRNHLPIEYCLLYDFMKIELYRIAFIYPQYSKIEYATYLETNWINEQNLKKIAISKPKMAEKWGEQRKQLFDEINVDMFPADSIIECYSKIINDNNTTIGEKKQLWETVINNYTMQRDLYLVTKLINDNCRLPFPSYLIKILPKELQDKYKENLLVDKGGYLTTI